MAWKGFGREEEHNKKLQKYWEDLERMSREYKYFHGVPITKSGDNALQVAAIHGQEDLLARMITGIKGKVARNEWFEALSNNNKRGDTLLHCAASRGSLNMCKCILSEKHLYPLVHIRNNEGETPLFLAALHGHKENFLYLHCVSNMAPTPSAKPWTKDGGDTILHGALWREYFDLSFQIINLYKNQGIVFAENKKGITPLHILALKPSSFRSGIHLAWCSSLLYYGTIVKPLKHDELPPPSDASPTDVLPPPSDPSPTDEIPIPIDASPPDELPIPIDASPTDVLPIPIDGSPTCHNICGLLRDVVQRFMKGDALPGRNSVRSQYTNRPPNYHYRFWGCGLMCEWRKIIEQRKDHKWCLQVMEVLIEEYSRKESYDPNAGLVEDADKRDEMMINYESKIASSSNDVKNGKKAAKNDDDKERPEETMTPFLTAVKNGVIEMVREILKRAPMSIHETTTENKNILLLAAENRQPHIIEELKYHDAWDSMIQTVDNEGNNLLHLAARDSKSKPWNIPGAAMQMQWEIKWYQYVEAIIPKHLIFRGNNKGDIPNEIFIKSHEDLVNSGGEWLKKTSESCSVVAALIAGVSFATSSSVPGGTNDQTGKPRLEGEPAFNVFAITSLASLCFSVTALIMFLAILTSRQQPQNFRRDLPFKLLFGLSFLFVSIVSMLVSFCAAYFFVLNDRLHNNEVFIIYAATCLPVTFYAVAQFPLYWDLLRAILTDVPRPTHKGG